MSTINDSTVVASAYTTSASARPQRLSNGWIVTAEMSTYYIYFQVSKDNGSTYNPLCNVMVGTIFSFSIASKGNIIYYILSDDNNRVVTGFFNATTISGSITTVTTIDPSQTAFNGCSLAIDSTGTYLHATWSSKNATYPNSFNIRYSMGTIAVDGSVSWETVVQVTNMMSGGYTTQNPTIVVINNLPIILAEVAGGGLYIRAFKQTGFGNPPDSYSLWTYSNVFASGYAQSSPSAIFVPQSINGLANGRIWVAWHGLDNINVGVQHIRVSYSDDLGVTWSAMVKLTTGNSTNYNYPSLTCNKLNDVFIVYNGVTSSYVSCYLQKFSSSAWGGEFQITSAITGSSPCYASSLYDLTVNFSIPLFIYKNQQTSKVGFYGTWTVTTISVTQGSIGTKADKTNLLSYSITTDGTMSTITEKVNGITVGTKTATSGQSLIAGLTQAQWDAIKYGKYNLINANADLSSSANWQQGIFTATVGVTYGDNAGTTRLTLISFINSSNSYKLSINSSYQAYFLEVNSSNIIVNSSNGWISNGYIFNVTSGNKIKIAIRKSDDSVISPSDAPTIATNLIATNFPLNTLTVTMGTDTFTYTFDKRLATTDDITTAMKAVVDAQSTYLPGVKAMLGSAIRSKGGSGSVNDSDSFDAMVSALTSSSSGRKASGTTMTLANGVLVVTGLTFKATMIMVYANVGWVTFYNGLDGNEMYVEKEYLYTTANGVNYYKSQVYITDSGFTIPTGNNSTSSLWWAYE